MKYTTYNECLAVAMRQSAEDLCCEATDFTKTENVIVTSRKNENARRYLTLPFSCQLVSYGNNVVASVSEELRQTVDDYIGSYRTEHIFETPNLHVLNDALTDVGQRICFMAEYFLPDPTVIEPKPCRYELRVLHHDDFEKLYTPEWSNALCADRRHLDVLGVGAYHNGQLVGLAACSADCDTMWQIGIDVLPDYRRQGIASTLTARLALEVLERGIVPFYCAAWSNIRSVRNAIGAGFCPAWVEMTAKPTSFVEQMNTI